jgi:hypothetical protein
MTHRACVLICRFSALTWVFLATHAWAKGPLQREHQFQGAELRQEGEWVAEPTLADLHARHRQELRDIQLKHAREYDQMRVRTRGLASMEARVRIQNQLNAEQDLEKQELFARHQAEVCSQFKVGCPKMRLVNPRSGAVRRMD